MKADQIFISCVNLLFLDQSICHLTASIPADTYMGMLQSWAAASDVYMFYYSKKCWQVSLFYTPAVKGNIE